MKTLQIFFAWYKVSEVTVELILCTPERVDERNIGSHHDVGIVCYFAVFEWDFNDMDLFLGLHPHSNLLVWNSFIPWRL